VKNTHDLQNRNQVIGVTKRKKWKHNRGYLTNAKITILMAFDCTATRIARRCLFLRVRWQKFYLVRRI
jgi:hypothetical protein